MSVSPFPTKSLAPLRRNILEMENVIRGLITNADGLDLNSELAMNMGMTIQAAQSVTLSMRELLSAIENMEKSAEKLGLKTGD